jgi:hypothetical protein
MNELNPTVQNLGRAFEPPVFETSAFKTDGLFRPRIPVLPLAKYCSDRELNNEILKRGERDAKNS